MSLRLDVIWNELPQFALGLGNTVWLCAASMTLSLLLGGLLMVPLMSKHRFVRAASQGIVDCGRCIPFELFALCDVTAAIDPQEPPPIPISKHSNDDSPLFRCPQRKDRRTRRLPHSRSADATALQIRCEADVEALGPLPAGVGPSAMLALGISSLHISYPLQASSRSSR